MKNLLLILVFVAETASAAQNKSITPTTPPPRTREQMNNLLGGLNHKDIEFYGKVVDQSGTPLPDVSVYASVLYNTGLTSGMAKSETKSGAQGLFSISGMKGRTLGLSLEKPGYEYDGEKGPFHFTELVGAKDRYTPDQKNPVILVMWKLQGAEPMVQFDRRSFKLPADGAPVRINLATGKQVTDGGDLVIETKHALAEPGKWLQRYPWSVSISAPGGGLIESTSRRMYQAPESGYATVLTYQETGKEDHYKGQFDKRFYVKTGTGLYARLVVDLSTQTNPQYPSTIGIIWWLNPSGSRNLEYDAAKTIKPPR